MNIDTEPEKEQKIPSRRKMARSGVRRPWQENLPQYQNRSEPNTALLERFANLLSQFGRTYNNFEMHGTEKLPERGPALIVFYHGLVPLDAWYFGMEYYIKGGRMIRALVDNWVFKTPILSNIVEMIGGVPADPIRALDLLEEGHLVAVAPGGTREAISGSSRNYELIWKERIGFAKLALEAKVPIFPAFTQNVESLYKAPFADHPFFQALYEKTRLPLIPILGLGPLPFPVDLKTFIGDPIAPLPNETAKALAERTRVALEEMISVHQKSR